MRGVSTRPDLCQMERGALRARSQFPEYLPEPGAAKTTRQHLETTFIFWPVGGLICWGVLGNRACWSAFKPETSWGLESSQRRLGAVKGWVAGTGDSLGAGPASTVCSWGQGEF